MNSLGLSLRVDALHKPGESRIPKLQQGIKLVPLEPGTNVVPPTLEPGDAARRGRRGQGDPVLAFRDGGQGEAIGKARIAHGSIVMFMACSSN